MDFQKLADYRNSNNSYSANQGVIVEEIRLGWAKAVKTVGSKDLNPAQVPHGGVYFVLSDTACAAAAASHGYAVVTINSSFSFLSSAALGDTLTAEASEVQYGNSVCVYEARVTNQNGELLSRGIFTMYVLSRPSLPD